MKADTATGTMVKHKTLADDTEGVAMEGKEKTHGREEGTEEDCVAVRDTKENASRQESVKHFVATDKILWELHRLLNNRKGSLSSTNKKNSEANNKVYCLNQGTVAALDPLAEVYETFEDTWDIVLQECAAGDMFIASEEDAAAKLGEAQRQQDDALEALEECRKNMDSAHREFSNYRALHEAAWFDVKETGRRHSELRKWEDAHKKTFLQRDCTRRATSGDVNAEEVLNNSVECLGTHVGGTANATHALTCGVPDRESNKIKYLREATEMIEEWQRQLQRGHSGSHPSCEHNEVVLIERQRRPIASVN